MTIHVLLADDQALLRQTFRILLDSCEDIEVVGEAADGREAVERARELRPDVVVMDIRMPGTDGLAATTEICADEELSDTRVLILTTFEIDEYVARALRAGASGFLGKDAGADDLIAAVRTVAAGESLLSPQATRLLISRFIATPDLAQTSPSPDLLSSLTARELETVTLAAQGLSNDEIAE
jgi:DNA-binding NarL/FixJ family response regulator